MTKLPMTEHEYSSIVIDSRRWRQFEHRKGDIIVCTPYKAGTTWTQMICALLVHQTPQLPKPLAQLSLWLDFVPTSADGMFAEFSRQTYRRIIKTHTPLDGLPYFEDVTYLYCGRDPRDVFISMQHHMANANLEKLVGMLVAQGVELSLPPPIPDDLNERFRLWMTKGSFEWERDGFPHWSVFHNAETFWNNRQRENIHFTHFADLTGDLAGEMRRIAGILRIEINESIWPELVKAATFSEMKANADQTAPDAGHGIWLNNSAFFRSGLTGQWRDILSEDSITLYQDVTRANYNHTMLQWLEVGAKAVGDPKEL